MKILVTSGSVARLAAFRIQTRAHACKTVFKLGLPTGSTVEEMYMFLRRWSRAGTLDLSRTVTFNMDEYIAVPPSDPHSYYAYMQTHLFDTVNVLRRYQLNALAFDLVGECDHYEKAIQEEGGIDLFIGGVGQNGHIAFNEPGTPFTAPTHIVRLTTTTRYANARFFGGDAFNVPPYAVTVGIGTILRARELLFLATGFAKSYPVSELEKPGTSLRVPLTALKTHPNATLLLDEEAASGFTGAFAERLERARYNHPFSEYWEIHTEDALC